MNCDFRVDPETCIVSFRLDTLPSGPMGADTVAHVSAFAESLAQILQSYARLVAIDDSGTLPEPQARANLARMMLVEAHTQSAQRALGAAQSLMDGHDPATSPAPFDLDDDE